MLLEDFMRRSSDFICGERVRVNAWADSWYAGQVGQVLRTIVSPLGEYVQVRIGDTIEEFRACEVAPLFSPGETVDALLADIHARDTNG